MDRFWDMLESSVLVQATTSGLLVATACYLWATGQSVPSLLAGTLGTVLGFWFGTKAQQMAHKKAGGEG